MFLYYVQAVFAKYRNLPNGGKERTLEIFFYDSPRGYPFADKSPYVPSGNDSYYRYGQLVGNTIQVYIGLGENFGPAPSGSKPWERVVFEIDALTITTFLQGNHDFTIKRIIESNGSNAPVPKDIDYLIFPHKFDLLTSNAS